MEIFFNYVPNKWAKKVANVFTRGNTFFLFTWFLGRDIIIRITLNFLNVSSWQSLVLKVYFSSFPLHPITFCLQVCTFVTNLLVWNQEQFAHRNGILNYSPLPDFFINVWVSQMKNPKKYEKIKYPSDPSGYIPDIIFTSLIVFPKIILDGGLPSVPEGPPRGSSLRFHYIDSCNIWKWKNFLLDYTVIPGEGGAPPKFFKKSWKCWFFKSCHALTTIQPRGKKQLTKVVSLLKRFGHHLHARRDNRIFRVKNLLLWCSRPPHQIHRRNYCVLR